MKKFNKIMSSLLICQLSLSFANLSIFAQETVDNQDQPTQVEPTPSEPVETLPPTEAPIEEPVVTSSEPVQPSETYTEAPQPVVTERPWTPQPTYPEYTQPNIDEFEVTEEQAITITDNEESTEETTEEVTNPNLDLRAIVVPSLTNPALKLAYRDYLYAINAYDFSQENLGIATMRDVQDDFQAYLLTGPDIEDFYYDAEALSEEATELGKVDPQPEIIELENVTLVNYHYYYANDFGQNGQKIASLQFAYIEDILSSVNLINHVPIIVQNLQAEELDYLASGQASLEDLNQMIIPLVGLGHQVLDGQVVETLLSISGEADQTQYEFIKVKPEEIYLDPSQTLEEGQWLADLVTANQNQIDIQRPVEEVTETSETMAETTVTETESTSSESESSQVETTSQETEMETSVSQESEETSETLESTEAAAQVETIIEKLPLDFSYDSGKLIGMGPLKDGYQKLMDALNDQPNLSVDELKTWFGEPTDEQVAGSSLSQKYLAVADDKVLYINVLSNNETGEVKQVKVDNRTQRLFEAFPIVIDDLFVIAENNEEIINQLKAKVGDPTVVEYIPESNQVRYVWTSFEDKAIKNIEAIQDLASKEIELLYYEP